MMEEVYVLTWSEDGGDICGYIDFTTDEGKLFNMLSSDIPVALKPILDEETHNLVRIQVAPIKIPVPMFNQPASWEQIDQICQTEVNNDG